MLRASRWQRRPALRATNSSNFKHLTRVWHIRAARSEALRQAADVRISVPAVGTSRVDSKDLCLAWHNTLQEGGLFFSYDYMKYHILAISIQWQRATIIFQIDGID